MLLEIRIPLLLLLLFVNFMKTLLPFLLLLPFLCHVRNGIIWRLESHPQLTWVATILYCFYMIGFHILGCAYSLEIERHNLYRFTSVTILNSFRQNNIRILSIEFLNINQYFTPFLWDPHFYFNNFLPSSLLLSPQKGEKVRGG